MGLQVGLRRTEIAALKVGDLHKNRGFDSLRALRKGGRRDALAIHPNAVKRIRAYLDAAGHGDDLEGPLFRPLSDNRKTQSPRRAMHSDAIDRVLRKHAKALGLDRGYSAHSMRATFITTALERTEQPWRTCRGLPDIVSPAPPSFTTAVAITRRSQRAVLRPIDQLEDYSSAPASLYYSCVSPPWLRSIIT